MTNIQTQTPLRTRRRIVLGAVAGVTASLVGLGAVGISSGDTTAAPSPATTPTATVAQGVYVGAADPSGVAAFAASTKTSVSIASEYLPDSSGWAGMDGANGGLNWMFAGGWKSSGYTLSLGVPMIPTNSSGTAIGSLATGATGAYNAYFVSLAQSLVANGESTAYLRLGWEFDGGWYAWSATTPATEASYAAYFAQIVTAMRAVPGANFRFVWNADSSAFNDAPYNVALAYPGNAYVNVIGLDAYDQSWVSPQTPANVWNRTTLPALVPAQKFAAAEGKPLALTEWGVATRADGHGLGDDPLYVTNMLAWMHNPANNVAYESYFNFDVPGQVDAITDGTFPNSLKAFEANVGHAAPAAPAPVATPTPAATPAPFVPVVPQSSPTLAATTSKPGAVASLTATVSGFNVALTWANPAGATQDRVYFNGVLRSTLAVAASSFSDINPPSGWHTYNVTASNAAGEGVQSNSVTVYIPAAAAAVAVPAPRATAAVTNLTASVNGTTVTLNWTNPSGAQSNHIYYNGVLRTTLASAVSGYTDVNPPSGWHTYNVTANSGGAEGPISNSVTVYIP